jgi:hypothetical protein
MPYDPKNYDFRDLKHGISLILQWLFNLIFNFKPWWIFEKNAICMSSQ